MATFDGKEKLRKLKQGGLVVVDVSSRGRHVLICTSVLSCVTTVLVYGNKGYIFVVIGGLF